ncbi:MAG: ATP-binding protein, partial [Bacteroidota bacterium]
KYIVNGPEKRVKIGHSVKNDDNTFYISDTGIGIDPKFSKKVFDLFERLEPEIEGTGIGLAIVKRVIEVHQGKIWVESQGKGKGSTFLFTLPNA